MKTIPKLPSLEDLFRMNFKEQTIEHLDELVQASLSKNLSIGNKFGQSEVIKKSVEHGIKSMKGVDTRTITGTLDLSKREIHSLIDDAAREVLNKYEISNPVSKGSELSPNKGCSVLLASIAIIISICIVLLTQ